MTLNPTVLVYSAHACSPHLHGEWLARRALEHPREKRLLYLPMSEPPRGPDEMGSQHFSWGRLEPFFRSFPGLEPSAFYWSERLRKQDVVLLFDMLESVPVVLLGSGVTPLGLLRFAALGEFFWGEPDLFRRLLVRRQERGLLTAGSSAGAKQLCSVFDVRRRRGRFWNGFDLAQDLAVDVHYDHGSARSLRRDASRKRRLLWFGLPNDSGLAVASGKLSSGVAWQLVRFVIDTSWHEPRDQFHVKTRQGMRIDHFYGDGRHWAFGDGQAILRVRTRGARHFRHAWMSVEAGVLDYWTQQPVPFGDLGAVLEAVAARTSRRQHSH